MASLRAQILAAVKVKLEAVRLSLGWQTLLENPREAVGEDQFNALLLWHGGDRAPEGLSGRVDDRMLEFTVGMMVMEGADPDPNLTAEALLDAGYSAVTNALIDPADIQLGGLAIDIRQGAMDDPLIGRAANGARIVGGQAMDFNVRYFAVEGDVTSAAP